ncbi:MAG: LuxR C-terminal-related transcriptional regulator [Pseudomonadota bacterium]
MSSYPSDREHFLNSSKIRSPNISSRVLAERPQLLRKTLESDIPLVVLEAPAGYGKTTLLLEAKTRLEEANTTCAWISLDHADNDVVRFYELTLAALRAGLGAAGDNIIVAAQKELDDTFSTSSAAERLSDLTALCDRPIIFLYDGYEVISNPEVHQLFIRFVQRLIPSVRVIVSTRNETRMPFGPLFVYNLATRMSREDFRVDDYVVRDYLNSATQDEIPVTLINQLVKQIDGWPLGITLGTQWLADDKLRKSAGFIKNAKLHALLRETAFSSLNESDKSFLLKLVVVDRFTSDLAGHLTQHRSPQKMIERLQNSGVFLEHINGETDWYQLSSLFHQTLTREAKNILGTEEFKRLWSIAARWFEQFEMPEEAVRFAILSRDKTLIERLIADYAADFLRKGRLWTLANWYRSLPRGMRKASPNLTKSVFWAMVYTFNLEDAKAILDEMANGDIGQTDAEYVLMQSTFKSFSGQHRAFALAHQETLKATKSNNGVPRQAGLIVLAYYFLQTRDFEKSRRHILETHIQDDEADEDWNRPNPQLFSATIKALKGEVSAALNETMLLAEKEHEGLPSYPVRSASLLATYGALLFETGADDEAEAILEDSLSMINEWSPPDWIAIGHVTLSEIKRAKRDHMRADILLDDLEVHPRCRADPRLGALVAARRATHASLSGDITLADEILHQADKDGLTDEIEGQRLIASELADLTLARLYVKIQKRDLQSALAQTQGEILRAAKLQLGWRSLKLETLKSVILHLGGEERFARRTLSLAIKKAGNNKANRAFTATHPVVRDILKNIDRGLSQKLIRGSDITHEKVGLLLGKIDRPITDETPIVPFQPLSPLTPRERELLELVAVGLTNSAIAERLALSENTVKWHLSRSYQKLGVRQRTHAVARAREAGILT